MKDKNIIDHYFGFDFPDAMRFSAMVIFAFSIVACFSNVFIGIILFLFSGFIISSMSGIKINPVTNEYMQYIRIYGIKRGQWKSLEPYIYICAVSYTESSSVYSKSNRSISTEERKFYMYLLNETHRRKLAIGLYPSQSEAVKAMEEFSILLGKEITAYHPQLSEKTLARKRR